MERSAAAKWENTDHISLFKPHFVIQTNQTKEVGQINKKQDQEIYTILKKHHYLQVRLRQYDLRSEF